MPWIGLEINNEGRMRPCCVYSGGFKNSKGQEFNISTDSIDDYMNSQEMQILRQQLLAGDNPSGCNKCWKEENVNVLSLRIRKNQQYKSFITSTVDNTDLISVDLKLSNLCNQKCVICNTTSSSLIASENAQILPHLNEKFDKIHHLYHWYKNEDVWKHIIEKTHKTKHFDFYGGEPWLIKKQWEFLQHLIDSGKSADMSLNYATNGSIHNDEYFNEYFSKFKRVSILYSADGIEETFEYNRFPAKWDVFKENLLKAKQFQLDNKIAWIGISYTVSAYSIQNIIKSLEFYTQHDIDVWFNMVNEDELSAGLLPNEAKTEILEEIKQGWRDDFTTVDKNIDYRYFQQELNRPVDKMWKEIFIKNTTSRDKFRGVSYADIMPYSSVKKFISGEE